MGVHNLEQLEAYLSRQGWHWRNGVGVGCQCLFETLMMAIRTFEVRHDTPQDDCAFSNPANGISLGPPGC